MTDQQLDYEAYLRNDTDNRSASVVQIESSRLLPWLILSYMFSGFAISFSMFTYYQMTRSEREFALVKLQLMDQQALLLRDGLVQPNDIVRGPAGNLYYMPSHRTKTKDPETKPESK